MRGSLGQNAYWGAEDGEGPLRNIPLVLGFWGSMGNQLLGGHPGVRRFHLPEGLSHGLLSLLPPICHPLPPVGQQDWAQGKAKENLRSSPALQLVWRSRSPGCKNGLCAPLLPSLDHLLHFCPF